MPFLNKRDYSKKCTWKRFYESNRSLRDLPIDPSWKPLFEELFADERFGKIEETLKELAKEKSDQIYPKPEFVFEAFRVTPLDELTVVILGQDPYFNAESYKDKNVPQAMGLSFSVPHDFNVPSSLDNIYQNLVKYGHIDTPPKSGNLESWAYQGCLLLNTALTVLQSEKNCHSGLWGWFTNKVIRYISDNCPNIVFVLWGEPAYRRTMMIDMDKHECIISSHPSGLSANKPMKVYPPFNGFDHFGQINRFLVQKKKEPIVWRLSTD